MAARPRRPPKPHVTTDIGQSARPEEHDTPVKGYSSDDCVSILKTELEEMQQLYVRERETEQALKHMIEAAKLYFGVAGWDNFEKWRNER